MRRHLRRTKLRLFNRTAWRTRLIFWLGAVLVGVMAAAFALLGEFADHTFREYIAATPWLPFVVTPLGFVLISWLTRRFFAGAEGSGIPQTLVAIERTGDDLCRHLLSIRVAVGKFILTVLGLFVGGSIGREGPTVHIGAAIMYSIGRHMHVPARYLERGLILTGGGAGIAAAFNTPLAGIMFAIEEMARSFDRRNSSMMLIGIVLAGMVAIMVHQDNYNYYSALPATLDAGFVWLAVLVCGVVGGVLGGSFSQFLISASARLRPYMPKHAIKIAFICGLIVAALGLLSGGMIYGTGYIEAKEIVGCAGTAACTAEAGVFYPLLKILATMATYLSGIPGGIFAPSLASGAGLGSNIAAYFPVELASAVVVLGMVGYFSAVVQTPITAFIIVMEMTDNQDLLLAMMATSLIATGTSKLICRKSIYLALAENFLANLKMSEPPAKPKG
ncbi:MAG: chloride channel protein [Gammaproteobacteria bacterium]|nr:chloride channel protein [Gammaproteobacteria bacterium]